MDRAAVFVRHLAGAQEKVGQSSPAPSAIAYVFALGVAVAFALGVVVGIPVGAGQRALRK